MARKNIYMNDALEQLEETVKASETNFSARLGEIVARYQILLELEPLEELTPTEQDIMNEVIWGAVIDRRKVRGLHLDVLDTAIGTPDERNLLSKKIEEYTIGQRLKLIEQIHT